MCPVLFRQISIKWNDLLPTVLPDTLRHMRVPRVLYHVELSRSENNQPSGRSFRRQVFLSAERLTSMADIDDLSAVAWCNRPCPGNGIISSKSSAVCID